MDIVDDYCILRYVHILTNVVVQISLGIPLELVHKWWRISLLYLLGVLCGSLFFYVFDRTTFLAGASGGWFFPYYFNIISDFVLVLGVYTLLSAHIANVIINWDEMDFNWIRASILSVMVLADLGVSIYQRYFTDNANRVKYDLGDNQICRLILAGLICISHWGFHCRTFVWDCNFKKSTKTQMGIVRFL